MADCSAIGSTIDRAATSTIEQNVTSAASKLVNSLWNSSSVAAGQNVATAASTTSSSLLMPVKPPTELPNVLTPVVTNVIQQQQILPQQLIQLNNNINGLDEAWNNSLNNINQTMNVNNNNRHTLMQQPTMNNNQGFMMQQQQQQMQMNIMYQQSQMMLQQQQYIQQQQIMKQKHEQQNDTNERLESAYEDTQRQEEVVQDKSAAEWDDNLEDEFYQEMNRLQNEVENYEEGMNGGVSIEELAEAWSQANIDNEMPQQQPRPYEFHPNLESYYDQNTTNESLEDISNNTDFMSLGITQFQKGEIHDAILSFQSYIQYDNTSTEQSKAWYMLGQCHAELDDDKNAIISLEHSIEHDPYYLSSLLALTVSYVNELDYSNALLTLQNFVTHNPKYAGMNMNTNNNNNVHNIKSVSLQDSIEELLLQAYEWDNTDVDILQALGVCYNINRNYDKAILYFRKALDTQQTLKTNNIDNDNDNLSNNIQLYQLWNKLGATLANSNQSTEALEAYHAALSIKPKYVRSWLNMAIAYSNLKNYTEASRCYLQTLSLNRDAEHCWNYLRIALSCLERWDLVELCLKRDLDGFRNDFDFV